MRIGLVLFGHLRSFRAAHNSYRQFLNTLQHSGNVDVFCHAWDIEESVTTSWWKEHKPNDPPPATVNANEIEDAYHPRLYRIESSRQFDDSDYNVQSVIPVAGILSMLHSQRQAFELLKEYETKKDTRYDVVIKARYDLLYEISNEFDNILKEASKDSALYLPSSNAYELAGSCSDIFAIGGRNEVEKYFSFCDHFKNAVELYVKTGFRQMIPELCMTLYLDDLGVKRKELTGLRLHILRMNGDKFQVNSDKDFPDNGPYCFYAGTIKKNAATVPEYSDIITINLHKLVKKYLSWIDTEADGKLLNDYALFYTGSWVPVKTIGNLAAKAKKSKVFTAQVMKNFFEEALHNAKYNAAQKFVVALLLLFRSEYGVFFIRVLRKAAFNSNK